MKRNNPPPLLAVRAFIQDDTGRILILKRASDDEYGDLWCLPGGKVDFGQTAEEAIIKEVQEETSLECSSVQFLFYMDGLPNEPGDKHYLTLFFECEVKGEFSINTESSEYTWIESNRLNQFEYAFGTDKAVIAYLELQ